MINEIYISEDVQKEFDYIKKYNSRLYKKIIKKINFLQDNKIDKLISKRRIAKMDDIEGDVYLYVLDFTRSIIFVLKENIKIFIVDFVEQNKEGYNSILEQTQHKYKR